MLEKVNQYHPDKVADRIAGAIVDYAYTLDDNPKIAVEVLVGHGRATVIVETSVTLKDSIVERIVERISDVPAEDIDFIQVPQDPHLAKNQKDSFRCGDNGVFTAKWNSDYDRATKLVFALSDAYPYDGKFLFDYEKSTATICQSNVATEKLDRDLVFHQFQTVIINPLGDWTGGTDADTGCTNRKLGSDQPFCNPNGLHGKDLSKADVSVSIYINALSRKLGGVLVQANCTIGDETVTVVADGNTENVPFADIVEFARNYVNLLGAGHPYGGFERFAEYGMMWDCIPRELTDRITALNETVMRGRTV